MSTISNSTDRDAVEVDEVRMGRNFVRVGDPVRVSEIVAAQNFKSNVFRIRVNPDGSTRDFTVRHPRSGNSRVVTPDRVRRMSSKRVVR